MRQSLPAACSTAGKIRRPSGQVVEHPCEGAPTRPRPAPLPPFACLVSGARRRGKLVWVSMGRETAQFPRPFPHIFHYFHGSAPTSHSRCAGPLVPNNCSRDSKPISTLAHLWRNCMPSPPENPRTWPRQESVLAPHQKKSERPCIPPPLHNRDGFPCPMAMREGGVCLARPARTGFGLLWGWGGPPPPPPHPPWVCVSRVCPIFGSSPFEPRYLPDSGGERADRTRNHARVVTSYLT